MPLRTAEGLRRGGGGLHCFFGADYAKRVAHQRRHHQQPIPAFARFMRIEVLAGTGTEMLCPGRSPYGVNVIP